MPSQFEVFAKCPKTGKLVNTGATAPNKTFAANEKPFGVFNCPSCGESHSWSYEDVEIQEVHR